MEQLKLFLISQNENDGYDAYQCALVAAENEEEAKEIHPFSEIGYITVPDTWCYSPDSVIVKYIGIAAEGINKGVLIRSDESAKI